MTARPMLASFALWAAALAGGVAGPVAAQDGAPAAAPLGRPGASLTAAALGRPPELAIHHSTPRAGDVLTLVVEGALPGADVSLLLVGALNGPAPAAWNSDGDLATELLTAPPSLVRHLVTQAVDLPAGPPGSLTSLWQADEWGRVVMNVALDDPEDVAHPFIRLRAESRAGGAVRLSSELVLRVHPPLLVLPSVGTLELLDLRNGTRLDPPIPIGSHVPTVDGVRGMLGLALSADGGRGFVLWRGGLLDVLDTAGWSRERGLLLHPNSEELASSPGGGLAFVLARPQVEPFTPAAEVMFVESGARTELTTLKLEPMGADVPGRRWAVTDDGLTAFAAADDLVVREIDLASRELRMSRTVGMVGDNAIADMVVVGRRLYTLTSRSLGRTGALSVLDLDTGVMARHTLDVAPLRLVALQDGAPGAPASEQLIVVPADGGPLQRVQDGLPLATLTGEGRWLDAAPHGAGAVLLREVDGIARVDLLTPSGTIDPLVTTRELPAVTRLVSGGEGVAILLGSPDRRVFRLDLQSGELAVIPGVVAQPDAAFALLP